MKNLDALKQKILNNTLRVSNDSRLVKPQEYYVAVKGDTFDGHAFIENALEKGAAGYIEEKDLYELVRFKLSKVTPKIVGVTGSSGKTTTTSFIYQLTKDNLKVTKGNLNTKLGLSMDTINNMTLDCDVFVAEMGMDRIGELANTTSLFHPNIAVITTINETHAEKLGSIENILKAKWEIVEGMDSSGIALLNYDNDYLRNKGQSSHNVKWFGLSEEAEFNPKSIDLKNFKIPGEHNKLNILASMGVALELGLAIKDIEHKLGQISLEKGRLNTISGINDSILLDDTYNASPASTRASLKTLAEYTKGRKIAILGDMLELGQYEVSGHTEIGKFTSTVDVDVLITVGNLGKIIYDSSNVAEKFWIERSEDFIKILGNEFEPIKNDTILIKGSQGARMEKITEALMAHPEEAKSQLVRQDARWK